MMNLVAYPRPAESAHRLQRETSIITNDEFSIQNDGFVLKMMNFCRGWERA